MITLLKTIPHATAIVITRKSANESTDFTCRTAGGLGLRETG